MVVKLSLLSLCPRQWVRLFSCLISIRSRSSLVTLDRSSPTFQMCNSETQRKQITEARPHRWSQASVSDFRLQCSGRLCCLVAAGSAGVSSSLGRGIALLLFARAAETLHLMKIGKPHRQLGQMLSWRRL